MLLFGRGVSVNTLGCVVEAGLSSLTYGANTVSGLLSWVQAVWLIKLVFSVGGTLPRKRWPECGHWCTDVTLSPLGHRLTRVMRTDCVLG